jgi:hypothetical protein
MLKKVIDTCRKAVDELLKPTWNLDKYSFSPGPDSIPVLVFAHVLMNIDL